MSIWAKRSTQYLAQLGGLQKASWRPYASFSCAEDVSITKRRKVMRLWAAAWAWEQLPGVCWSLLCVRWSGGHAMES